MMLLPPEKIALYVLIIIAVALAIGVIVIASRPKKCSTPTVQNGIVTCTEGPQAPCKLDPINNLYECTDKSISCGHNGLWSSATCNRKSCADDPYVEHATISSCNSPHSDGQVCNVIPDKGMECTRNNISCNAGEWDTYNVLCNSVSEGCTETPDVANGKVVCPGDAPYAVGTSCRIAPNTGFNCSSGIKCKGGDKWTTGYCQASTDKACHDDPDIEYGVATCATSAPYTTGTTCPLSPSIAGATCSSGVVTCLDGIWNPPFCSDDQKQCSQKPDDVDGGVLSCVRDTVSGPQQVEPPFAEGDRCTVVPYLGKTCPTYYTTCVDGEWNNNLTSCTDINDTCTIPTPENPGYVAEDCICNPGNATTPMQPAVSDYQINCRGRCVLNSAGVATASYGLYQPVSQKILWDTHESVMCDPTKV